MKYNFLYENYDDDWYDFEDDPDYEDDFTDYDMEQYIKDALSNAGKVDYVQTYSEAGVLTQNRGVVVYFNNGESVQLTMLGKYY